jgi:hypothetical protein
MDHRKKLLELLGTDSLREYSEPRTCEEFMEMGRYYSDMFDNVFARGELHVERVRGEFGRLLAETVQPLARETYGVADSKAVRQLFSGAWGINARDGWGRQMNLMKTALGQTSLSQGQQTAFLSLMDTFPDTFLDLLSSEVARLKLVPIENVNEISLILSEMFKEGSHADQVADN